MSNEARFFEEAGKRGFKPDRLRFYVYDYLFKGIDLQGRRLLDIGGGYGAHSFAAVVRGARAVVLEPEAEGSRSGLRDTFESMRKTLGLDDRHVRFDGRTLQDYQDDEKFDLVLLNNSINHLNEPACIDFRKERWAEEAYLEIFRKIGSLLEKDGIVIIADCTSRNFWPDVGRVNPFMRSIEWHKHQPPEAWAAVMRRAGFGGEKISWSTFNALGNLGRVVFGNRLAGYFSLGHFKLAMRFRGNA